MRSIESRDLREKRIDLAIKWGLGALLPALVTGAFYYTNQGARFQIVGIIGCANAPYPSGLTTLTISSWSVIFSTISALFYCRASPVTLHALQLLTVLQPKFYVFYRHRRDTDQFLQSSTSISRTRYMRVLALGCLDILFTLPSGIVALYSTLQPHPQPVSFYPGWDVVHDQWQPRTTPFAAILASGRYAVFQVFFPRTVSLVLSLIIFALFGLTDEARGTYRSRMSGLDFDEIVLKQPSVVESGSSHGCISSGRASAFVFIIDAEDGLKLASLASSSDPKAGATRDENSMPRSGAGSADSPLIVVER
ncbi:pheromone A receptor-domain-containing protein [Vararia minispora EC-137]|uniref:Pheromone A receptor-domain-containing protein n=1 Tax=Vararia minispora EC-137 TaxID=1314806 RepID=A0ACB8QE65_9AGAM|nr:pheromone A receptor-domain-containing protein [Vararia minispora EC-137]